MIKPGTLCLIVGGHVMAGKSCTVVELLSAGTFVTTNSGATIAANPGEYYEIDIPGAPCPSEHEGWCAHRTELVPIAPPGFMERDDKRERIEA